VPSNRIIYILTNNYNLFKAHIQRRSATLEVEEAT